MNDISGLTVTTTIIFDIDRIPFSQLCSVTNLQKIFTPYNFKNFEFGEDENKNVTIIYANNGEFQYENKTFPIQILTIEGRRISYRIQADSTVAEAFYLKIHEALGDVDIENRFKGCEALITVTNTTCVVTLGFDFQKVFSSKMNSFINGKATGRCKDQIKGIADVQIIPSSLSFEVKYEMKDKDLKATNVGIQSKKITIEPRLGTNIKERRYFTSSPTDSKTHLELITELEKAFTQ